MPIIYFDHASTGYPKSNAVASAIYNYLIESGLSVNRGNYEGAYSVEELVFDARNLISELFSAPDPRQVIFTSGVTESMNVFLKGLLKPGDHIIVSSLEHNAVMRPLRQLEKQGVSFTRIPSDAQGSPRYDLLHTLIQAHTKAVLITHASNVSGEILDLSFISQVAKEHDLFFALDTAQTAGLYPISVKELGIDFLGFTGHKTLGGPQGIGGFVVSDRLSPLMEPLLSGGTGSLSHTELIPNFLPDRYEAGTPNLPGIIGLKAGIEELLRKGPEIVQQKEMALTSYFIEGLHKKGLLDHVRILGPEDIKKRCALVSLELKRHDASELAYFLEEHAQIYTRVGLHCAPHAHMVLGTERKGALRFSFGFINRVEEIDICLDALELYFKGDHGWN